jgi:hypothetical protein
LAAFDDFALGGRRQAPCITRRKGNTMTSTIRSLSYPLLIALCGVALCLSFGIGCESGPREVHVSEAELPFAATATAPAHTGRLPYVIAAAVRGAVE